MIFIYFIPKLNVELSPARLSCPPSTARVTRAMHSRPANPGRLTWAGTLSLFYLSDKRADMHQHAICAALERAAAAVMIDKSGNGDTYTELLSGSGSAEMKSDGLSLGRRVTAAPTQAAGEDGAHLRRGRRDDNPPHDNSPSLFRE